MKASGGTKAKAKISRIKFREYGELLHERELLLKMKGTMYQSCVKTGNVVRE